MHEPRLHRHGNDGCRHPEIAQRQYGWANRRGDPEQSAARRHSLLAARLCRWLQRAAAYERPTRRPLQLPARLTVRITDMHRKLAILAAAGSLTVLAGAAAAQQAPAPAAPEAAVPPGQAAPPAQQFSINQSVGDWVVRCV